MCVIYDIKELMGEIASHIESLENVFNFSVPYISWFILIFFLLATIFLYFVPLRLLVLVWVVNRFRKGLIKNRTDTNEVINFLSRVPDNEELVCSEISIKIKTSNFDHLSREIIKSYLIEVFADDEKNQ